MSNYKFHRFTDNKYSRTDILLFDDTKESHQGGKWYLPWSDLTFILFILLFSYVVTLSNVKADKILKKEENTTRAAASAASYRQDKNYLLYLKTKKALDRFKDIAVDYLLDANSIRVSIFGPMFFDTGSDELKSATTTFLNKLAETIKDTDYKISVIGHTDNVPISTFHFESNWELSVMRATKVARYLIEHRGIDPKKFTVSGNSLYKPKVPNISPELKARNRRVELIINKN